MVKARKVSSELLDAPQKRAVRKALSPAALKREAMDAFLSGIIGKLANPSDVFEISLEPGEKAITVRQRILKVAGAAGTEVVVRKHGDDLLVGLLTTSRKSNRGRRNAVAAKA
jgi:hypothetical protein